MHVPKLITVTVELKTEQRKRYQNGLDFKSITYMYTHTYTLNIITLIPEMNITLLTNN